MINRSCRHGPMLSLLLSPQRLLPSLSIKIPVVPGSLTLQQYTPKHMCWFTHFLQYTLSTHILSTHTPPHIISRPFRDYFHMKRIPRRWVLELIQLPPRFDFPEGTSPFPGWQFLTRPVDLRLPVNVHLVRLTTIFTAFFHINPCDSHFVTTATSCLYIPHPDLL